MKNQRLLLLLAVLCIISMSFRSMPKYYSKPVTGQKPVVTKHLKHQLVFKENKGQISKDENDPYSAVSFYGNSNGVSFFCRPGMISFIFKKTENQNNNVSEAMGGTDISKLKNHLPKHDKSITQSSRIDLVFKNANRRAVASGSDRQAYTENYYTTGDANNGICSVGTYKIVIYHNIYPKIDLELLADGKGLEYSFIVHPGGAVSDIKTAWQGFDDMQADGNGGYKYDNAIGTLSESEPRSFANGKEIGSGFKNNAGFRSFVVNAYDKTKDLVIDPGLTWATYLGGPDDDETFNLLTLDGSANIYITGFTASTSGIASSGAFMTTYNSGGYDMFLAKYNSSGTQIWSTYFGGTGDDVGNGIVLDGSGNIFLNGNSTSPTGMATTGAYQTSNASVGPGGTNDAILAEFNSSGILQWSTYYGGENDEDEYQGSIDASGNLYISGYTYSTTGIASSPSVYQSAIAGGIDAYLAKFDASGSRIWSTYFGGSSDDLGFQVAAFGSNKVYLAGQTNSSSIAMGSGAFQTTFGGASDGFLVSFDGSGNLNWSTYFGDAGTDGINGLITDASGNIYITGNTSSTSNIATSGTYQTTNGGGSYDAFLARFSSNGSETWSTYFGGPGDESGWAIATDPSGYPYITGNTTSTSEIATPGAYQSSYGGAGALVIGDAFLARFDKTNGNILASTYFGGSDDDIGYGVAIDGSSDIYLSGNTASSSGIATSGAYQSTFGGGGANGANDVFLAKFSSLTALPVKLLSFDAALNPLKTSTLVTWSTASEINNNFFAIEKSSNGLHFLEIGEVKGAGNSQVILNYQFTDRNVDPGVSYYRLKQVDYNGAYSYSNIAAVEVSSPYAFSIFPNPVCNGNIQVSSNQKIPDHCTCKILNQMGQIVQQEVIISSSEGIAIQKGISPGIYFVKIDTDTGENILLQKILIEN